MRGTLALLIFATFSVLWASLALELGAALSLSHGAIGAFGLAGAAGALAAVRAGRMADRGHGQRTTGVALALMLVAWLPIALPSSLLALVAGLLLLDFAVQAVHVTNQSISTRRPGGAQPARRRLHGLLLGRQRRRLDRIDRRPMPGRAGRASARSAPRSARPRSRSGERRSRAVYHPWASLFA